MKSIAFYFAVLWVLVSSFIFGVTISSYYINSSDLGKQELFIVYLTLLTMLLGLFFVFNYKKITLYLKNYKREKHI